MMPIDPLAVTAKFQELYAAYPGVFHGAGVALTVIFLYFAVTEIVARVAKQEKIQSK